MHSRAGRLVFGLGLLIPVLLAPLLRSGGMSIAFAVAVIGGVLAWISPALPAALDGVPAVIVSLTGTNPLPTGATVALLTVWTALGVAFAIVRAPREYPLALFFRAPIALSAVLAVLMIARLGSSPAAVYGDSKLRLFVLVNLTSLVVGVVVARRRRDFDLFVVVLFVVTVFASLALIQAIVSGSAQEVFTGRQSLSQDFNPIALARSMAKGALLCVYFLASRYVSPTLRVVAFALLPVFAVALVATGSRGPLLALLVGLTVLFVLVLRQGRGLRYVAIFLCALVVSVVVVPRVLDAPGAIDRALSVFTDRGSGLSSNGRDVLWGQATDLARDNPVLGVGTGGFAAIQPIEKYPHNLFLEVASELGFLGLVLVVGFLVSAVAYLARAWQAGTDRERSHVALTAALFATALVDANFSGDITGNSSLWFAVGLATGLAWRVAGTAQARAAAHDASSDAGRAPAR